ncbi:MAG: amidohydrolase family protein, partial [Pseudomonadota bacterium]
LGALPMVHAENGDIVADLQQLYLEKGVTGPEGHSYSRPPEVEGEAANRAIMIADAANVPLYVVHVSCEQAHEAIRRARQKGMRVYGEPLVQYLVLDDNVYANPDWDYAARRVMSPPFRGREHQDGLWAGLQAGSLQVVATDHCAFSSEQKRMGVGDFTKIPNGSHGLEERLAVLWTHGVETGRLTPSEFVALTSTNIAKILNIYPKKGALIEGADADVVVWDPKISRTYSAANHHSILDYSVWEGFEVSAQARYTLSRGEVIWAWGRNSQPKPGRGRFVPRPPFPPVHSAYAKWRELNSPRRIERDPSAIPAGV